MRKCKLLRRYINSNGFVNRNVSCGCAGFRGIKLMCVRLFILNKSNNEQKRTKYANINFYHFKLAYTSSRIRPG